MLRSESLLAKIQDSKVRRERKVQGFEESRPYGQFSASLH